MNIYWLKRIRKESWNKYEVRKSDAGNADDRPWSIYTSPTTSLAYEHYTTKEAAIRACQLHWHEEAKKFLWNNRDKRKKNKYPW